MRVGGPFTDDELGLQVANIRGLDRLDPRAIRMLADETNVEGGALYGSELDGLLLQIAIETGGTFNPAAKNPNGTASGLIQMTDETARGLGIEGGARQVRSMSAIQQVPFIVEYYRRAGRGRELRGADWRILGYSSNPSLLDAPDAREVYGAGTEGAKANTGAQDEGGAMTVGAIRREWARQEAAKVKPGAYDVPVPTTTRATSSASSAAVPLFFCSSEGGAFVLPSSTTNGGVEHERS